MEEREEEEDAGEAAERQVHVPREPRTNGKRRRASGKENETRNRAALFPLSPRLAFIL